MFPRRRDTVDISSFAESEASSSHYAAATPRPRLGRSASKRVSQFMSMALPSRIASRLFPDSSNKEKRKSIATVKISAPILINTTNISAPDPQPQPRPASTFDTRSKHFSSYEDYNTVHLRTSVMSGNSNSAGLVNFF